MRSSKSRSRSKHNRHRSVGNIVNRVFDSSGPEGKVRGTPQQIIEKYNQLGRDSQLSNDRVAAENFQQHAEHYLRLLGEALKEQESRRENSERESRERTVDREREKPNREISSDVSEKPNDIHDKDNQIDEKNEKPKMALDQNNLGLGEDGEILEAEDDVNAKKAEKYDKKTRVPKKENFEEADNNSKRKLGEEKQNSSVAVEAREAIV